MKKTEAERAAEATRRAIAQMMKPKKRRESLRVIGEAGPRGSMWFDDEYANTNPVIFDRKSPEWRKADGKWVQR